jgi:hypothetical protein
MFDVSKLSTLLHRHFMILPDGVVIEAVGQEALEVIPEKVIFSIKQHIKRFHGKSQTQLIDPKK